jgi:hypothetical protein
MKGKLSVCFRKNGNGGPNTEKETTFGVKETKTAKA